MQIVKIKAARQMGFVHAYLLGLRAGALLSDWRRPLPLVGFTASWIRASTPSDSVTNRSISHRPAGSGGVSVSTKPVAEVQSHEPSSFDIGANDRLRRSMPSDSFLDPAFLVFRQTAEHFAKMLKHMARRLHAAGCASVGWLHN
jgi:hypothetical protein